MLPDLSILICAHNRLDLTRACLSSLFRTLPGGLRTEVLFYDDQSTDGTAEYLAGLGDVVTPLRGQERGTFGTNMNTLAVTARGRWLCLLNNDTILHPGWLSEMLHLAAREPRAAAIGNFHRYPQNGRVNHAGVVFDEHLSFHHLYQGLLARLPATFLSRPFQCVSAACMLVRRDLFADLGGFDEGYRNGCEDLDLCLKIREAGREVWYCGTSRIDHYGQSTPGRMNDDGDNLRRFRARWAAKIRPDLRDYAAGDGVIWPSPSWTYRAAYRLWKTSAFARGLVMRTKWGVRLRQRALAYFV